MIIPEAEGDIMLWIMGGMLLLILLVGFLYWLHDVMSYSGGSDNNEFTQL